MLVFLTMFIFSLTLSFSPGPVNMVIISSGAVHGFRKTFSFFSGATIGFTLLLIFICFGFYAAIEKYPVFFRYLNIAGSLFIMCLGYKIASSRSDMSLTKTDSPGFIQGFVMQWINPKAWTACASGAAMFSEPSREGANKQVMSSQADSLIKISRIWADFFPANTSNQPI